MMNAKTLRSTVLSIFDIRSESQISDAIISAFLSIALFSMLHLTFQIIFETNDDVLFSMLAHGYGVAAEKAYFLPASNSLITYIVQAIPSINTIPGYVILSMSLLILGIWGIFYFMLRLKVPFLISFFVFILISLRTIILPQFTVTSGILTVAAILALYAYLLEENKVYILIALLFASFGCLMRMQEFLLILGCSIFILPFKKIFLSRCLRISMLMMVILICIFTYFDHRLKRSPALSEYTDFLYTMIPIWNYGAADHLLTREDILQKYGYSKNDIHMLHQYFYMTPKYTDTKTIASMLEELGGAYTQPGALQKGKYAINALRSMEILPLLLLGISFLFLPLTRKQRLLLILSWITVGLFLFAIGYMGRPGRLRIYFPIATLLLVAPFLSIYRKPGAIIQCFILLVSLCCVIMNSEYMLKLAHQNDLWVNSVRKELESLPTTKPVYSWGRAFPYEAAYPVFGDYKNTNRYDIPLFGGYSSAPFSTTITKMGTSEDFFIAMKEEDGILTLERDAGCCESYLKPFGGDYLDCSISCENVRKIFLPAVNLVRVRCK